MKPGGGKSKGGGFERDVGAKLSLWISGGQRKDLICRTVGSGAQFTTSKYSKGNPGDLMAQHAQAFPLFNKWVIECKFWKSLDMIRFLSKEGELYNALNKVYNEAQSSNKRWMLIAKQNHKKEMIFMPSTLLFPKVNSGIEKGFQKTIKPGKVLDYHTLFSDSVDMFVLDDFLESVEHDLFIQYV